MRDPPPAHALAIEPELVRQHVQPAAHTRDVLRAAKQPAAIPEQRSGVELALARERLRVDRQPRLASRAQDVAAVEVLVEHDLVTLLTAELEARGDRLVDEATLERPPG